MMLASGKTYTRASLVAEVIRKFGPGARFHTCSAEGLTAEELVAFLEAKGKLLPQGGGFQTAANLMCDQGS